MAWHSFIVIFNLYLGVKHSRFYGRLILLPLLCCCCCYCCCCCSAAHWRMICRDRIGFNERVWVRMYLCTAQWIADQSTHIFWSIVNRSHSCRTHTHTQGNAKEIPREHDRKNEMRLLANKSDIKNMWARRQPWPYHLLKINNEMASISR